MSRAAWPGVGVQTAAQLLRKARRLDRRVNSLQAALARMEHGARLNLYFDRQRGPVWRLSIGGEISPDIAKLVIANPKVVAVGASLFEGCRSQTYRYAD